MSDELLVQVENVSKKFCRDLKRSLWYGVKDISRDLLGHNSKPELRSEEFWALRDISFELKRGESLGLIGANGAGKTTLLTILNGLIKPDKGRITVRGRVGALISLGAGFNPVLTGRENIYINAAVLGIPKRRVDRIIDKIIDFAGVEEFINTPVQSYSSGMRVRLGFAIAAQLEPDVLIVDEVLAVGDAYFRRKCITHMQELFRSGKTTVILVSHNIRHIEQVCNRAIYLEHGQVVAQGETSQIISQYMYNSNTFYAERATNVSTERWGSGEIRFVEADVRSARTGEPYIEAGDPITVRAKFKCFKPVKFVRLRVGLRDFTTQTLITMADIDVNDLGQDGEVVCTFPDIYLHPRSYSIYLSATDLLMFVDELNNSKVFVVARAGDDEAKFLADDQQLLHIPHSIKLNFNSVAVPENRQANSESIETN